MNPLEKRYGIKENELTKKAHLERRMFCIYKNSLQIAEPNLPYSHAEWFLKKGWMTLENDNSFMEMIVRGINKRGDLYFYTGRKLFSIKINANGKGTFWSNWSDCNFFV